MSTLFGRFTGWANRTMPTRDEMARNRFIPERVMRSELWRFTRRSVPRGVALGLLVGIIVPFAQIFFAAFLCLSIRANVPVASLTTFVTNPFTTPFLWMISYQVGKWLLQIDAMTITQPIATTMEQTDFAHALQWMTGATLVTAFGLVVVAIVASIISYFVTGWIWAWWVAKKRRARLSRARLRIAEHQA